MGPKNNHSDQPLPSGIDFSKIIILW